MIKFENTEVMGWEHAIRGMFAKGYRQNFGATALANKFGVDRTTISDVVNSKTWRYE